MEYYCEYYPEYYFQRFFLHIQALKENKNEEMDYEGILRQSNSLLLLGFLAVNVRSRSVVVITCASHAQGPRFEPGRDHLTWTRDI